MASKPTITLGVVNRLRTFCTPGSAGSSSTYKGLTQLEPFFFFFSFQDRESLPTWNRASASWETPSCTRWDGKVTPTRWTLPRRGWKQTAGVSSRYIYTQHRTRGVRVQAVPVLRFRREQNKTKCVLTLLIILHVGWDIMATVPAVCLNRQTHFLSVK